MKPEEVFKVDDDSKLLMVAPENNDRLYRGTHAILLVLFNRGPYIQSLLALHFDRDRKVIKGSRRERYILTAH